MAVEPLNRGSLFFGLSVGMALSALVSEVQANSWLSSEQAFLQTLDKITARIATVPLSLDEPIQFGTLEIELKHCAFTPPEVPPEAAAFLEIRDVGFVDKEASDKITVFSGWMFASSPAVSSLEHPVYDVTLLACAK
jgi:hypothetical protein